MRKILAIVGVIFIVMAIAINFTQTTGAMGVPPSYYSQIPEMITPGNLSFRPNNCYIWEMSNEASCWYGEFTVIYSHLRGEIITVYYALPKGTTVGDIITAWGDPIGVEKDYSLTYLWYSNHRKVVTYGPMYPKTPAIEIEWEIVTPVLTAWRGFDGYR